MLRIKCLERNRFGQLVEIDLGPIPAPATQTALNYGKFDCTVGDRTFKNCYVESEDERPDVTWRVLGYAVILVITTIAGFVLKLAIVCIIR